MMNLMVTAQNASAGTTWSLGNFLGALQGSVLNYVKIIIVIIGIVMVGFGVYQIAKNLISHGKGQTNWVVTFALIIVGGTLMLTSGFDLLTTIGRSGKGSIENLGSGQADNNSTGKVDIQTILVGPNTISFGE